MSAPSLPVETIEQIVRFYCQDRTGTYGKLVQLATVNTAFRFWIQPFIFRHLKMSVESSRPSRLLVALKSNPIVHSYVREVTVLDIDHGPAENISDVLKIFEILGKASVIELSLATSQPYACSSYERSAWRTPGLQSLLDAAVKTFGSLQALTICDGIDIDLQSLHHVPQLTALTVYNTSLDPEIPFLEAAPASEKANVKLALDHLAVMTRERNGYEVYDPEDVEFNLITIDNLQSFGFSTDKWVSFPNMTDYILPAIAHSLVTLVIEIWDLYEFSTVFPPEIRNCHVLENLRLDFIDCTEQFSSTDLWNQFREQAKWGDQESIFVDMVPPPSLKELHICVRWQEGDLEGCLAGWAKHVVPELDRVISTGSEEWSGLQKVQFSVCHGDGIKSRVKKMYFPAQRGFMERTMLKGVEVVGLQIVDTDGLWDFDYMESDDSTGSSESESGSDY